MSISGYGATLVGTALGSLSGVKRISVGGLELDFDEIATLESYIDGTATFTTDSDQVTGTDTAWTSAMAGRRIRLDADDVWHTIASVEAADALTLTANYSEAGGEGAYTIAPSRVTEHLPTKVREQPIEVTMVYDKTVYDTLRDAALARTEDTWTLTDSEGSTDVGLARVQRVGGRNLDSDGHAEFTVTLQPSTNLAFTAAL